MTLKEEENQEEGSNTKPIISGSGGDAANVGDDDESGWVLVDFIRDDSSCSSHNKQCGSSSSSSSSSSSKRKVIRIYRAAGANPKLVPKLKPINPPETKEEIRVPSTSKVHQVNCTCGEEFYFSDRNTIVIKKLDGTKVGGPKIKGGYWSELELRCICRKLYKISFEDDHDRTTTTTIKYTSELKV
ncbi:hypothetical protein BVC80_1667g42 [Macleaya cordata]|uniref:Uncharacterized protein n=1 Tax=Macleaya cordata TaxID=56857 RepID=A0A200RBC5_MACCD|nr:hypothetical protein BVC80_1667g42 [Macleaya cordata]